MITECKHYSQCYIKNVSRVMSRVMSMVMPSVMSMVIPRLVSMVVYSRGSQHGARGHLVARRACSKNSTKLVIYCDDNI